MKRKQLLMLGFVVVVLAARAALAAAPSAAIDPGAAQNTTEIEDHLLILANRTQDASDDPGAAQNTTEIEDHLLILANRTQDASDSTLVSVVRTATEDFQDLQNALDAGYGLLLGCVTGDGNGAMGVHYVNGDLVGDALLDAERPEVLMYEPTAGGIKLTGAEFVVFYDAWHENNETPPVLMGQLFNYVGSPNRYGIPAFYELHVWAWKDNPNGAHSEWNPKVDCSGYVPEGS